ncbi:hypothetical protein SO694_00099098 [Aureococcus anophagefferens]|uniref:beta-N-acetylhexosaminidase n=1 Tax=Aureococcus anophagefferens TaxID=44056 RepID=A0ABR1FT25_AURAN
MRPLLRLALWSRVARGIWPTPRAWSTPADAGVRRLPAAGLPALTIDGCEEPWCGRIAAAYDRLAPPRLAPGTPPHARPPAGRRRGARRSALAPGACPATTALAGVGPSWYEDDVALAGRRDAGAIARVEVSVGGGAGDESYALRLRRGRRRAAASAAVRLQYALRAARPWARLDAPGHGGARRPRRPARSSRRRTAARSRAAGARRPRRRRREHGARPRRRRLGAPGAAGVDDAARALSALVGELAAAAGAAHVHVGGDEVDAGCWAEDAPRARARAGRGFEAAADWARAREAARSLRASADAARAAGATPVFWDDALDAGDPATLAGGLVQIWRGWLGVPGLLAYASTLGSRAPSPPTACTSTTTTRAGTRSCGAAGSRTTRSSSAARRAPGASTTSASTRGS